MDLVKEIKKAYLARREEGKTNKMITLTPESIKKFKRIEKTLRNRIPGIFDNRGMLSLFVEAVISGCEVELRNLELIK